MTEKREKKLNKQINMKRGIRKTLKWFQKALIAFNIDIKEEKVEKSKNLWSLTWWKNPALELLLRELKIHLLLTVMFSFLAQNVIEFFEYMGTFAL